MVHEREQTIVPVTPEVSIADNNFWRLDETFPSSDSSISLQLITRQFLERFRKTPRWQPRGHDTQSFRPLVQEE